MPTVRSSPLSFSFSMGHFRQHCLVYALKLLCPPPLFRFRRNCRRRAPPTEGSAFGSAVSGPMKTTVVEGLVIPAKLDSVQATNFVLTQQARDKHKESITPSKKERQHVSHCTNDDA